MNTTTAPTTTERRARPRPHAACCSSNQCHQGRTPCPTPQACELPDEEPATAMELTGAVLAMAAFVVSVLSALFLALSA